VLMLDLDPQSSLSIASGVNLRQAEREGRTSTDLLEGFVRRNEVLGAAALSYQVAERLDLIVTTLALHRTEALVREATAEELVLRRWFAAQTLDYDVVLIDSAPAKSPLTMNALCAAHSVIVPVQPEFLAVQGLAYLFETIREVQLHGLNPNLQVDGVLITMTETRTVHAREMHEDVVAFLSRRNEETPVLGEIRRSIRVAEAVSHRQPITRFAPQSDQAQTYERIAARLARRWRLEAPAVAAASR
jgi:chromosome partitioning protein